MRTWVDPRDGRAWKVTTYWFGQAMGVGFDVDVTKIPATPSDRRIEFLPADGQGPPFRTTMGDDERQADELIDEELQELLDRVRASPELEAL